MFEGFPIHPNRCESSKAVDESSNRKSIRGGYAYRKSICKRIRHTGCRFANRHPVRRIVICCDESFDSSRIVSNRQHLLLCMVFSILTIDLRSFYALRTWKVHVVMFSYHATHFHSGSQNFFFVPRSY